MSCARSWPTSRATGACALLTSSPIGTLTTRDRYALVWPGFIDVDDCTLRMLAPKELGRGMAFADDYVVTGSKREQVAGYGNAVTPPVAEVLFSALVEILM